MASSTTLRYVPMFKGEDLCPGTTHCFGIILMHQGIQEMSSEHYYPYRPRLREELTTLAEGTEYETWQIDTISERIAGTT